jgi:hypothetical protein
MPSIALPTGPYDWRPHETPRAIFEQRVAVLRGIMAARGISHCVVHGNCFDHASLLWLAHFTPKLGPAYLLVGPGESLRMLFAGGPGMKPSAQALTWVSDVAALRGIEKDVQAWLAQSPEGASARVGLVTGHAMLRGDWLAVGRAAQGRIEVLDEALDGPRAASERDDPAALEASIAVLREAAQALFTTAAQGGSQRAAVLTMERAAYGAGAQDVRIRMARRVWGAPVTLPDDDLEITGPMPVALAVRSAGRWSWGRFVVGPMPEGLLEKASRTAPDPQMLAMENSVGVDEAPAGPGAVAQAIIRLPDEPQAIWSLLIDQRDGARRILWTPPGIRTTHPQH